jgi:hypothetical protein
MISAGTVLALLSGLWLSTGTANASGAAVAGVSDWGRRPGQRIAVPAYWAPGSEGGATLERLAAAAPQVAIAIVNGPQGGPPVPFDPATAETIRTLHAAGIRVLGYVDTGYLGRTGLTTTRVNPGSTEIADWREQARLDARTWSSQYGLFGLGGVFLDQALSTCGTAAGDTSYVRVYRQLADAVRDIHRQAFVAVNPGTDTEECYARVADTIVIFENTYLEYLRWTPPSWVRRYPASKFWHLVHAAPTQVEMRTAMALSRQRGAGYVYVTDDTIDPTGSPWDTLPPQRYWADELGQLSTCTSTSFSNRNSCLRNDTSYSCPG